MTELLAPVGSVEALRTAVFCHADAVYLGLDCFNARIKANNFTLENIKEHINFCHTFGVKVYITFNTSIKQKEIPLFKQYVQHCANCNVDAFIVTDLGMLDIFRQFNVPLHASTQLGIHNLEGALIAEQLGFCRVVVSRETLESDIIKIKQNTNLEVEYFVHGALCVAFSGNCLMSSMMSGDSGNRGRCNQPCRLPYSSDLSKTGAKHLLSTADLCMIQKLDRLMAIGIDSFKIEGRLKQPHYVGEVVSQYRYAIDNHLLKDNCMDNLRSAYNRGGFTFGYNYDNTAKIMSTDIQGNYGRKIGKIIDCKNQKISFLSDIKIHKNDGIKIIDNFKELGGMAIDNFEQKGKVVTFESTKVFPKGSQVHLTLDSLQVKKFSDCYPKLKINMSATIISGKPLLLQVELVDDNSISAKIVGEVVQPAQKVAITKEQITKQLDKLFDSCFVINKLDINTDNASFVAVSVLNQLRRSVLSQLQNCILEIYKQNQYRADFNKIDSLLSNYSDKINYSKPFVVVNDLSNIDKAIVEKCNLVLEIRDFSYENIESILKSDLIENNIIKELYLYLPRICRGKDITFIKNALDSFKGVLKGCICDNLYAVFLSRHYDLVTIGGLGLNIYNDFYPQILGLDGYFPSVELNLAEINQLKNCKTLFAFGRLVIMNLTHCPLQLNTKCNCTDCKYITDFSYKDKKEKYFVCRKKIDNCYFDVFNPQIVDVRNKIDQLYFCYMLNFNNFSRQQINQILDDYINKRGISLDNCTYAHLFRGVK